jgi:transcriptional regulator with XRE-family HTH domain
VISVETLGEYLRQAREAREVDLRDAAQQTRISIQYLKALENEDFSKLPGEVFVRGFLKNYCRFLNLDEAEVMKRYSQLKPQADQAPAATPSGEPAFSADEREIHKARPLEPFVWGAVILIALIAFLFNSLPADHPIVIQPQALPILPTVQSKETTTVQDINVSKLYLKVVALEDTWLLIRTDGSPQKKAILKQGESLTWSADERFLLSYARVGALRILLNGEELSVRGEAASPVRDLAIARSGILKQPFQARPIESPKRRSAPAAEPIPSPLVKPDPARAIDQKAEPAQELNRASQPHATSESVPIQTPPVTNVDAPSTASPSPSVQSGPTNTQ